MRFSFYRSLISCVLIFALIAQSIVPAFATLPLFQNFALAQIPLRQQAAAVIGENAAQEIGAAYHGGELNKFAQLVAHAAVGCVSGAVASGDCGSGALGGVVGELTGEIQQQRIEQRLHRALEHGTISQEQALAFAEDMRAERVDLARLAAGLGAALGGGDASAAANTGGTAAEENAFWIPLIMIVDALWTAYDAVTTYRDEGGEAVLQQLALDGAITVATAGAGKVVYKVGGKVFRSGPKAWQAVKKAGLWRNNVTSTLPKKPSQLKHIFRDASGHLPDTPANRQLLLNTSTNPSNKLGVNRFGNEVFTSRQTDGSQVWVEIRNGIIQNGGVNNLPKKWISGDGLR